MHIPTTKDKLFELYFHITKNHYVTKYLACSELAGKWMFKNSSFVVIPNAVDFAKFQHNPAVRRRMRADYNIMDYTKVIGFCGRLTPQKNPQLLVRIFGEICKRNINVKLLLLGDGPLKHEVISMAENLRVKNKLIFPGAVDNVEDYMQMMDCFLLPSRFEGFGIVLLEAQAAGINCITTKDVVPSATNLTGHVFFVNSQADAKEWADELFRVGFEHYNEMEKLLVSDYTVEKSAQKLMKVFEIV